MRNDSGEIPDLMQPRLVRPPVRVPAYPHLPQVSADGGEQQVPPPPPKNRGLFLHMEGRGLSIPSPAIGGTEPDRIDLDTTDGRPVERKSPKNIHRTPKSHHARGVPPSALPRSKGGRRALIRWKWFVGCASPQKGSWA